MQRQNLKFKNQLKGRLYQYSIQVINAIDTMPKDRTAMVIGDQLLRSTTSIGANIFEAQAASSKRDFANFLNHSLKSANESLFWFTLLKETKKMNHPKLGYLVQETQELANILGASILTLRGKRNPI